MTTLVQFRRGTTAQNNTLTGAIGEITVDTTVKSIRVHDGVTLGGTLLMTTATSLLAINNQSSNYNILSSDVNKKIRINSATTATVLVPLNSSQNISVGSEIKVRQVGVGHIQINSDVGVTLNVKSGVTSKIAILGGEATLHKVDVNEWDVTGDLSA